METYDEKITVEIFTEEDVDEETFEIPEKVQREAKECIAKIEENLSIEMHKSQIDTKLKTKIPFHRLTEQERRMWGAVCPHRSPVERYRGHIPLRVLKALEFATSQKMFEEYEIYSEYSDNTDPILVGKIDESGEGRSYNRTPYLIARWGESLFSVAELRDKAIEASVKIIQTSAEKTKSVADSVLASVESHALAYLTDGRSLPYDRCETPTGV